VPKTYRARVAYRTSLPVESFQQAVLLMIELIRQVSRNGGIDDPAGQARILLEQDGRTRALPYKNVIELYRSQCNGNVLGCFTEGDPLPELDQQLVDAAFDECPAQ
jgi:hypothetical protein